MFPSLKYPPKEVLDHVISNFLLKQLFCSLKRFRILWILDVASQRDFHLSSKVKNRLLLLMVSNEFDTITSKKLGLN
jgi:hypothetical protein